MRHRAIIQARPGHPRPGVCRACRAAPLYRWMSAIQQGCNVLENKNSAEAHCLNLQQLRYNRSRTARAQATRQACPKVTHVGSLPQIKCSRTRTRRCHNEWATSAETHRLMFMLSPSTCRVQVPCLHGPLSAQHAAAAAVPAPCPAAACSLPKRLLLAGQH
jgi:hypothetical protein